LGIPLLNVQTHENGPKTQKRRVFRLASQTCTECYGPCRSPRNPKTMGNSSRKWPKMQKCQVFSSFI
jgi:hypothetical protein